MNQQTADEIIGRSSRKFTGFIGSTKGFEIIKQIINSLVVEDECEGCSDQGSKLCQVCNHNIALHNNKINVTVCVDTGE